MFKNYLAMLFSIFHINGDLIEIDIELEHGNLCPNPIMYRSGLIDQKCTCEMSKDDATLRCNIETMESLTELFESCNYEKYWLFLS